ncbi:hypothetical protein PCANB_001730 [Pneumocystis canis]|nr:hypothetical protein PCANB_001730 [Pneumocystis canis]
MNTKKQDILKHHHRSSIKKTKKKFKSRKKTKRRIEMILPIISKKKQISFKADRKNTKKQVRIEKRNKVFENNKIYTGDLGISKLIMIVPLCVNVDPMQIVQNLNHSINLNTYEFIGTSNIFNIEQFKQKLQYIIPKRHFIDILDFCKVADFVLLLMSATEEVDLFGKTCLRSIQAQGISTIIPIHMDKISSLKKKKEVKKSLLSFINHFFPEKNKIFSTDHLQEALNVLRMICVQTPPGIQWRDERSYILAEEVNWKEMDDSSKGILSIKGIIRSKPLDVDRLIHIPGWGDYQINKIIPLDKEAYYRKNKSEMMEYVEGNPIFPTENQDSLEKFTQNVEIMEDIDKNIDQENGKQKSIRVDNHYYFSDNSETDEKPRSLPPGTSDYQATWIIDSDSDTDDDNLSIDTNGSLCLGDDNSIDPVSRYENESDTNEMDHDHDEVPLELLSEDANMREYEKRKKEREEDREFPDEVEVPFNISAKERFKKYRGLKNFKTSPWDPNEYDPDAPDYWKHIYKFSNYKATKKRVIKQAYTNGVKVGTYVIIEIRNCEKEMFSTYCSASPFIVFSLLQYEHLLTASNFLVTQNADYEFPVKSKDELILQYGPRRILVNPLFSQSSNTRSVNNVHKFERYLQQKRPSIASVICPIFFGTIPILLLKNTLSGFSLVATGSFLNTDHTRIIAKKVILTGYPFKIYKKTVIIRYMFFNPEDVEWFKPVQLFTKYGRTGYIKETLGTHGHFKAIFDGKINQQDTVALSLYKRVYPHLSEVWRS